MFEFRIEVCHVSLFGWVAQQAPYGRAPIALFRVWAQRIASLKGKILLHVVYWREVVVFDFAELEEATIWVGLVDLFSARPKSVGRPSLLFAGLGSEIYEEVNNNVAYRCLQ